MKVLVTGAGGYLGRGVVRQLCDAGVTVIATDIRADQIDCRAHVVTADLFNEADPYIRFQQPDAVLHMAWRNGFVHNAETHMEDLPKHCSFIKKMLQAGVKQIAVMGSMHEIGFWEGCIDENTPCNPQSLYGISKNALRQCCQLLCEEHKAVLQWLRGYYIVGNGAEGASIFSKIVKAEREGAKTFPFTLGQNQYDFIQYEDFCHQVCRTVMQTEVQGIINICSGKPEKLADRVERFIKDNQFSIRLEYGVYPDRKYDSKAVWGSDKKVQLILDGE